MPNVFTPIIPNMTTAFQSIAQEAAILPAIAQTDFRAQEAALNETVTIPIAPPVAGDNRTPAAIFTVAADRNVTNTTIAITKDRKFPFYLTGDDFARMRQNPEFIPRSFTQALRSWRNEVHSDLAGLHVAAAGYYSTTTPSSGAAVGTAGTTPFGSNIDVIVDLEKLLNDSLAPLDGRVLMVDTAAKAALGKRGELTKANEAGNDRLLREGFVGRLAGFDVAWANDVKLGATIAGSGYQTNGTQAVGATGIVVQTGTGAIPAGTVVAFAADTVNRYVVATDYVGGAGTLTLTSGLVNQIAGSNALTLSAGRRNMAFHREALGLAIRLPKMPPEGDAGQHEMITDPVTGIGVMVSTYRGYGLNQYELSSAWGVKAVRPEWLKLLLG
jgi:hypothetical protein